MQFSINPFVFYIKPKILGYHAWGFRKTTKTQPGFNSTNLTTLCAPRNS